MVRAYIGLGSNLGDRLGYLRGAVRGLAEIGKIVAVSSLYETTPVGYLDQPWFLNAVVALETGASPEELHRHLLGLEEAAGRERPFPNAPRTLDLDLLFYDDLVLNRPELTIPHPRLHERAFVLVPLFEIAPNLRHPTLHKPVRELLAALGDVSAQLLQIAGSEWASGES
ncbi:2-amino-4-hydroxy-6-hydroxymethyldihydropteridine diphosphokinase [Thermomicrobiaceae bacterium CFH 74404]|uniref:2-amino-4-hydroxy-6-hydroxymethyldihydropteridine pyrophosphokinase n=2 Tax=Thermomicrobia TaxID=189775 RepID=A0AA42BBR5_9BACT|nr:2-amino-4-hydroxy-6-hydroxymethyldihydropteridine diphosphokinase [Thermalbibacter longus]MCM8750119.1 2-amino-4-hydroxy-6-hydroxymethyldihydropteridine diphosphokinase [Thermalbibacter longus]